MRKPNCEEVICVNCSSTEAGQQPPQPAPSTPRPARALPNGIVNGLHRHEEEEIEAAPRPLRDQIQTQSSLAAPTTNIRNAGQVDSSQAIAEKMLEGWALLAEHCPLCSTPFVRSRDGRIYCVTCDLYAVREGESAQQEPNQAGAVLQSSTSPPRINTSSGVTVPSSNIITTQVDAEDNKVEENASITRNIATAQSSVAARLAMTSLALEKASSTEATTLLEEVKACVEALSGIRALLS